MRRKIMFVSAAVITISVIFSLVFKEPLRNTEFSWESLSDYLLYLNYFSPVPDIDALSQSAGEILEINIISIDRTDDDLMICAAVNKVIYSEQDININDNIWIYLPVAVDSRNKYVHFVTYMNIPTINEKYIAYLKNYVIADVYDYSDADKKTFLFVDQGLSMFPCKNNISVKVFSDNSFAENARPVICGEVDGYDCFVRDDATAENIIKLFKQVILIK